MKNGTSKDRVPYLFKWFHALSNSIGWLDLGLRPAPVQRLQSLPHDDLWIKRNDLISSELGGNKVRRLEFILADTLQRRRKHVITLGGIGSNHCLAVAKVCSRLGLRCTLCLFQQPLTCFVRKTLLLYQRYGAEIVYAGSLGKSVLSYYIGLRAKFPDACFIEAGGASPRGVLGTVNAVMELKEQIADGQMPEPDIIMVPTASNGGFAGLMLGCGLCGLKTNVLGVRAGRSRLGPLGLNTTATVAGKLRKTYAFLRRHDPSVPEMPFPVPEMINGYFGEGYGVPTAAGNRAMRIFREQESIQLEPVYTAKTCAALLDMIERDEFRHKTILYWHTYAAGDVPEDMERQDYTAFPQRLRAILENGATGGKQYDTTQEINT